MHDSSTPMTARLSHLIEDLIDLSKLCAADAKVATDLGKHQTAKQLIAYARADLILTDALVEITDLYSRRLTSIHQEFNPRADAEYSEPERN